MQKNSILFILIVAIMSGCAKRHLHSATDQNNSVTKSSAELRVLCYNIHHANPPSKPGLIDVQAIVKVINDAAPDLVALQEIDVHTGRSGSSLNQAEAIASKTGMQAYFARSIDYDGGEYGIAILSKHPLTNLKKYELPTIAGTKGEPRVLATAQVQLPSGKEIVFACTHLDALKTDTNRVVQIQKIIEILKKESLPVILAGDLNAVPGSSTINKLDQHFTRTCLKNCGFTIPEVNPNKTIDFIAFHPSSAFNVMSHQVIQETYASDHLPVFSTLEVK